ncbi:hypothetical protein AAVH_14021 [Aphelenchoides avenae]|nr:hypothetical protein AAVH_14021 [Aphelenchus avenae]
MRLARVLRRIKRQLSKHRKTKDSLTEKHAPVFTLEESDRGRASCTDAFDDADDDNSTFPVTVNGRVRAMGDPGSWKVPSKSPKCGPVRAGLDPFAHGCPLQSWGHSCAKGAFILGFLPAHCRLVIAGRPKPVDNANPAEWTVLVTDGCFKAHLFTEFKPSFGIDDEVVVTRIAVRPDGASGRLNLFIKNYAHVNPAAEKKLPRPMNMEEMPFLAVASC